MICAYNFRKNKKKCVWAVFTTPRNFSLKFNLDLVKRKSNFIGSSVSFGSLSE
jgi:hypothetical protein